MGKEPEVKKELTTAETARWDFVFWTSYILLCVFCLVSIVHTGPVFCLAQWTIQVRKFLLAHPGQLKEAHKSWMESDERAAIQAAKKGIIVNTHGPAM